MRGGSSPAVVALLAACLCALAGPVAATFRVEKGGLKVKTFGRAKYPGGFDMALANFGAPVYGGALMGKLVYVHKDYGLDYTCSPPCNYGCQGFGSATPRLDLHELDPKESFIMLVDRGPADGDSACKFAQKVWNAQRAGARGAIVVNYEDKMTTMEAPDDDDEVNYRYLRNITIPATFITRSSGDALKGLLRDQGAAYVTMDWTDALPRQVQVDVEFWTNSNDQCGPICDVQSEFIKQFDPVAREFDQAGWTRFTPHYIVWVCPEAYRDSAECKSQCIRHGRYCAPDPDGSIQEGYSGSEVVQENLRQLCVFELGNASGRPWVWWDYVTRFAARCSMDTEAYGEKCAEEVFEELNQDKWGSVDELRRCIGSVDEDTPHSVMDAQLAAQAGDDAEGEVFILPTLRINKVQYRGRLAVADVLRAICAGFAEGNRPAACDRVVDDACIMGGKGYEECAARSDGKTQCVATWQGYNCTCGHGFLPHMEPDGSESCLDINECLSITQLDPNCTCDRCACKNTWGGYECITDIPDECATHNGGCWQSDAKVKGQTVSFSACHDNLPAYKDALAHGRPVDDFPLHNCTCPACFTGVEHRGKITCTPRCNLDNCDPDVGVCHAEPGSGGVGGVALAFILVAVVVVVAAAGLVAYKVYVRGVMQAEVRAVLSQYMPLGDADNELRGLVPPAGPSSA